MSGWFDWLIAHHHLIMPMAAIATAIAAIMLARRASALADEADRAALVAAATAALASAALSSVRSNSLSANHAKTKTKGGVLG